ncbi:hypothetical protein FQN54_004709 [Arachnomyces sp. PD_36]|nr:hypothetical protein FQN54_004709 [Arachnomyces sp. PD_36]
MPCWKRDKHDLLLPSRRKSQRTTIYSRKTWYSLRSSATHIPDSCSNIRPLLHKTPGIPDASSSAEIVEPNMLFLEGYSQWRISGSCSKNMKRSPSQRVNIGVEKPAYCSVSNEHLLSWVGFETHRDTPSNGNYLCVFVLGWSYVLSALLIELRREDENDKILYTDETADIFSSTGHFPIPIGNADAHELRWWAAILAGGCGWRATLARRDKKYFPPWACHLSDNPFSILCSSSSAISPLDPPSSAEARNFLCRFARLHDAFDQLIAAFAAALTLPRHIRSGTPIVLPEPKHMTGSEKFTELIYGDNIPSVELPYFMSLACIPNAISSCLSSCFWEPGIDCNVVSEWLHPPLQEVLPQLIHQKRCHTILCMMAARQPNLASLWLGSAITGLLPKILQINKTYLPSICLEATVWTASLQSFMDPKFHRKPRIRRNFRFEKVISREDEFRLLYLTDLESQEYGEPPKSPYPPLGVVKLRDTALEVRRHVSCGHALHYSHWVWQGLMTRKDDFGFTSSPTIPSQLDGGSLAQRALAKLSDIWITVLASRPYVSKEVCQNGLSQRATRDIFSWIFFADGVKEDESEMWKHEWLEPLLCTVDDDYSESDASFPQDLDERSIDAWLDSVE